MNDAGLESRSNTEMSDDDDDDVVVGGGDDDDAPDPDTDLECAKGGATGGDAQPGNKGYSAVSAPTLNLARVKAGTAGAGGGRECWARARAGPELVHQPRPRACRSQTTASSPLPPSRCSTSGVGG